MIGRHLLNSCLKQSSALFEWHCSNNFRQPRTCIVGEIVLTQLFTLQRRPDKQTHTFVLYLGYMVVSIQDQTYRILRIIADWLSVKLKTSAELFVDLNDAAVQPLSNVFDSLRPDIAIKSNSSIITLGLTICHESNISSSREYKINKYKNLINHLTIR